MTTEPENVPADERVRRSVRRTVANVAAVGLSIVVLGAWAWFGFYQLDPGQAAVILRLGRYSRTMSEPGLRWHLPPPLEDHEVVNVGSIEREDFSGSAADDGGGAKTAAGAAGAAMQTSDNNIVNVGFVVQYKVKDAFLARYRVASPRATLRDAAQAAMREVVGQHTIDGVLSEQRGEVAEQTEEILQKILDGYETGLAVISVQLQEAQAPAEVRAAFDDVIAAGQDRNRAVNEAEGYANEVLPKAEGEAAEQRKAAEGYRDAKIATAQGEAQRFEALLAEYQKAPEVTRERLYLETMETVLPQVEKVIIEPGTANVLPYLPIGRERAVSAPPPPRAPASGGSEGAR
ncbi:MAG TPA: FtsH protease activity modulator HflK [Myxococcota bacterium]|jgi:membrane protease subunit HflK|nr:FtsH protease activity modulator HflK [Myxococcota bacterium]